jgi:hypothetical protein
VSFQQDAEAWHSAKIIIEAALRSNYNFERDPSKLITAYLGAFRTFRSASMQVRDGSGNLRADVHATLASASNEHRELLKRVAEHRIAIRKQRYAKRRSPTEKAILELVEPFWEADMHLRKPNQRE